MIIIGLHGEAGAGKSTAALILQNDLGFHIAPFAGPLKRMSAEYGLTKHDMTEGKESPFDRPLPDIDERKAQKMLIAMGIPLTDLCITPDKPLWYLGGKTAREARSSLVRWWGMYRDQITTPRRFLQFIGTEWGLGMVSPQLWLNMWDMECLAVREEFSPTGIVVDDVRMPNEPSHVRAKGGKVIMITRATSGSSSGSGHASERRLEPHQIDESIENDGTEAELRAKMHGILNRYFAAEAM